MWRRLLNIPLPDQTETPERVQRQASTRIRRYWTVQIGLMLLGTLVLWASAEAQQVAFADIYLIPVLINGYLLIAGMLSHITDFWLLSMVGGFAFQGMLVDGLGGVTSISFMLPYTFAAMILPGRRRTFIQVTCVLAFWVNLMYEILPAVPQLQPRRLILVSYNILIATLTFQTLRFLNRLAVELNTAYVAQEVTQRSQQFLARVSHELRTPLNSVLGFAKMLRRADLVEPQTSYLKQIVEEGEQLNKLVSDLLDSAHLATGKMRLNLAEVEVNAVCETVAGEARSALKPSVNLHLHLSPDLPKIQADELRLRQIVRNLTVNAAKYTEHGEIRISTSVRGGLMLICVSDTGPGIPEKEYEMVFVPFVKRDNRTSGVGLGLDIARQLTRLHGGDIRLESEVGQGSSFTVELPLIHPKTPPTVVK
ncbi:two-component system, cell cycle sensor histidine kinase PleC [Anaerolineae bacterium]|nr:two-component system, cell cycle sensor histidine kinase PleC [Anaerolineae bacterium]